MRVLRSLQYNLRHGGFRVVASKAIRRVGRFFYRKEEWLLLERSVEPCTAVDPSSQAQLAELTLEQLRDHGFFKALHYPEDLARRLDVGDLCLGVFFDGRLAHVAWMARHRLPLDPGLPDFGAPDSVGIYDMFTLPEFRRRGCQRLAIEEFLRRASRAGLPRAVTIVDPGNAASLAAFHRSGFHVAGTLVFRRVLGRERLSLRTFDA